MRRGAVCVVLMAIAHASAARVTRPMTVTWHSYAQLSWGRIDPKAGSTVCHGACADRLCAEHGTWDSVPWTAINQADFGIGASWEALQPYCGRCVSVTLMRTGRRRVMRIIDAKGAPGLDLSPWARATLGARPSGDLAVARFVPCPTRRVR